jgi:hypothetical protein
MQILFRAIPTYTAISSLAHLSSASTEALVPIFRPRADSTLEKLLPLAQNAGVAGFITAGMERANLSTINGLRNSLNASCLVFSHSLADGAIEDLCLIAADFDPAYWKKVISKQTVSLGKIIEDGTDCVIERQIKSKIHTLSLPKKMDHLLRNAGKHANVTYSDFIFDKTRLLSLDRVRHEIIHGRGAAETDITDSQEFFFGMTMYAGVVAGSMIGADIAYPGIYVEWFEYLLGVAKIGFEGQYSAAEVNSEKT